MPLFACFGPDACLRVTWTAESEAVSPPHHLTEPSAATGRTGLAQAKLGRGPLSNQTG